MKLKSLFLSLLPLIALISCTPNEGESSSQSSGNNDTIPVSLQIDWADSFKQEEDDYLVFFYSETCEQCHQIMGDVIAFANSNIMQTYFSNILSPEGKMPIVKGSEPLVNVSDISEFYIAGTPTLIEVKEGTVIENIPGKDACLTFLNNVRLNAKK